MDTVSDLFLAATDRLSEVTRHLAELGWTALPNPSPAGGALPPVGTDLVVARADVGVALLDLAPHRAEDPVARLRARLAAIGAAIGEDGTAGHLPVVHLVLGADDEWRLTSLLDVAFAREDGITRGDDWIRRVEAALATEGPPATAPIPARSALPVLAMRPPSSAAPSRAPRGLRAVVSFWGVLLVAGTVGGAVLHALGPPGAPGEAATAEPAALPGRETHASTTPAWTDPTPRADARPSPGEDPAPATPPSSAPPPGRTASPAPPPLPPTPARQDSPRPSAPAGRGSLADLATKDGNGAEAPPARHPQRGPIAEIISPGPSEPRGGGPSRPEATGPSRIVVHHAPADLGIAASLAEAAARPGYRVETRPVPATPSSPAVRYFSAADRAAAERLAAQLGPGWRAHDFSGFTPRPSRGTLEVWLPRRGREEMGAAGD